MVGELITLPLRVGVRATQLWLRVTGEAAGLVIKLAGRAVDRDKSGAYRPPSFGRERPGSAGGGDGQDRPAAVTRAQDRVPSGVPAPAEPPLVSTTDRAASSPPAPEPAHVSEQPELVEELAEPGAEDGAGAQVRVREPWDGYKQLNAKQVVAKLATATPAQLAAVQLYENGHRGRQTILAAVKQGLRSANGSGSPDTREDR